MIMKKWLKQCIFSIFILIGVLFMPEKVMAADLKLTYEKEFNTCLYEVLPSYDNNGNIDGFLYFTREGVIKQDLNNKIVYSIDEDEVNVDVIRIDSSNTEGYVVKGETDLLIRAVDDDGNILFTKQFGGNGKEGDTGVINSYNDNGILDGYLVVFTTLSSDLGIEPVYGMLKLDLKGNILWIKNINDYLSMDELFYVDNNQLFVFETGSKEISKYNIFDDQLVFNKDTGIYISSINYSYNSTGVRDGIMIVGKDDNYYATLIKYDLDGNEIFRVQYDKNNVDSVYIDVISSYLPDGSYDGYIVTAATGDNKTLLIKYDLNGKKIYEKEHFNDKSLGFYFFNNYDNRGGKNGYLLIATLDGLFTRTQKRKNEVYATQNVALCYNFITAKYTYDIFPVVKEENNGGTINVKSGALPGELVKVNVLVKEGYSLQRIIVKDENGKEIEVNSDGTFIMPEGKVTVSAIYKRLTNPDTVSAAYMVLGVILIASVGSLIVIKKRDSY